MPLSEEIKAIIGEKATEAQLAEMLLPEAQSVLESKGHIIRTKDQDDSYISTKVEEQIKPKISDIHKRYDEDFFEILGERKSPNEKTYEFAKRKLADLKTKAESKVGGDQVSLDKIKELEKTIATMTETHTTELSSIKQKAFNSTLDAKINSVLDASSLAYPVHVVTDEEKATYQKSVRQMIKTGFTGTFTAKEDEKGNLVFYKGEEMQSSSKDGQPLTINELISENYKQFFSVDAKGKGGAGGGKGAIPEGGFKTTEEIYTYLDGQGLERNTKKFTDAASKLIKEHGIVL